MKTNLFDSQIYAIKHLHVGALYKTTEPVTLYGESLEYFDRFYILPNKSIYRKGIYMYIGPYPGLPNHMYYKFLCGGDFVYMCTGISYLKELKC
jgi:hypothetical protein